MTDEELLACLDYPATEAQQMAIPRLEAQALEHLHARYAPTIYRMALHMLESHEEAEEIVQDTFSKIHQKAWRFDPTRGSVKTFLYSIARNFALSRIRARRVRPQVHTAYDIHDANTLATKDTAKIREARLLVTEALATLSASERSLLEASFYKGYSHQELAAHFNMPLGTLKSKLRRALHKLRDTLEARS